MTVEELMEALDRFPADANVVLSVEGVEKEGFTVELADTGEVVLEDD